MKLYSNIAHLAQAYFHQDFQDDDDEPVEIVERFRDSESAEVVEALRAEIAALIGSGATEEELSRIWLDDAGAYYDPTYDDITVREWLLTIADVLSRKKDAGDGEQTPEPAAGADAPAENTGIPFKGSTKA